MTAPHETPVSIHSLALTRPRVAGKFIFVGDEKLYLRGVTYGVSNGTTAPVYRDREKVANDLAALAESGVTVIRTPSAPPLWLMDLASRYNLHVLAGLGFGVGTAFLDDEKQLHELEETLAWEARNCGANPALFGFAHPALLGFVFEIEIPQDQLTVQRSAHVEDCIRKIYEAAKRGAPKVLCSWISHSSSGFLQVGYSDFVCCDLSGDPPGGYEQYLAELQWASGDLPLVILGLEDDANLGERVRGAFGAGCAGVFVAGQNEPGRLREVFADVPFPANGRWPRISIVVDCISTKAQPGATLQTLRGLPYPDYEVVVAGRNEDAAAARIASEHGVRFVGVKGGVGEARNEALAQTTGEIITFLDLANIPDPDWLHYVGAAFNGVDYVAVGGPTMQPPAKSFVTVGLVNAPAGPLTPFLPTPDGRYTPLRTIAFRRSSLENAGGFDPRFAGVGVDIDICWRLNREGGRIGYLPAALLWAPNIDNVGRYWKQQRDEGFDEMLLRRKWPQRFGPVRRLATFAADKQPKGGQERSKVLAPGAKRGSFSLRSMVVSLIGRPLWYLLLAGLLLLSLLGIFWGPLLLALPLLLLAIVATVTLAAVRASRVAPNRLYRSLKSKLRFRGFLIQLNLLQPLAVLVGQLRYLFNPPGRGKLSASMPLPRVRNFGDGQQLAREYWLRELALAAQDGDLIPARKSSQIHNFSLPGLVFGSAQVDVQAKRDAAAGRVTITTWPRIRPLVIGALLAFLGLALLAQRDAAWLASAVLGLVAVLLTGRTLYECAVTLGNLRQAVGRVAAQAAPLEPAAVVAAVTSIPAPVAVPAQPEPVAVPAQSAVAVASDVATASPWLAAELLPPLADMREVYTPPEARVDEALPEPQADEYVFPWLADEALPVEEAVAAAPAPEAPMALPMPELPALPDLPIPVPAEPALAEAPAWAADLPELPAPEEPAVAALPEIAAPLAEAVAEGTALAEEATPEAPVAPGYGDRWPELPLAEEAATPAPAMPEAPDFLNLWPDSELPAFEPPMERRNGHNGVADEYNFAWPLEEQPSAPPSIPPTYDIVAEAIQIASRQPSEQEDFAWPWPLEPEQSASDVLRDMLNEQETPTESEDYSFLWPIDDPDYALLNGLPKLPELENGVADDGWTLPDWATEEAWSEAGGPTDIPRSFVTTILQEEMLPEQAQPQQEARVAATPPAEPPVATPPPADPAPKAPERDAAEWSAPALPAWLNAARWSPVPETAAQELNTEGATPDPGSGKQQNGAGAADPAQVAASAQAQRKEQGESSGAADGATPAPAPDLSSHQAQK